MSFLGEVVSVSTGESDKNSVWLLKQTHCVAGKKSVRLLRPAQVKLKVGAWRLFD